MARLESLPKRRQTLITDYFRTESKNITTTSSTSNSSSTAGPARGSTIPTSKRSNSASTSDSAREIVSLDDEAKVFNFHQMAQDLRLIEKGLDPNKNMSGNKDCSSVPNGFDEFQNHINEAKLNLVYIEQFRRSLEERIKNNNDEAMSERAIKSKKMSELRRQSLIELLSLLDIGGPSMVSVDRSQDDIRGISESIINIVHNAPNGNKLRSQLSSLQLGFICKGGLLTYPLQITR